MEQLVNPVDDWERPQLTTMASLSHSEYLHKHIVATEWFVSIALTLVYYPFSLVLRS
jgi:hypothetical protein